MSNTPSIDPANIGTLMGLLRHVFSKQLQDVNGMLPARVIAINGNRNQPRVTVQPLVALLTTDGSQVSRAQIASVPVFQIGAGGYLLSFPVKEGDLGWIMANDRDISVFLQSYSESRPQTVRKNNFADAVFFPDSMRQYTIASEDQDNAVLQNAAGSTRVAIWPQFVKVTATRGLSINAQPNTNTIFDMASTTKASRPWPRMTQTQRDAIPSPQEGMVVWNTTTHGLSTYNGTSWS